MNNRQLFRKYLGQTSPNPIELEVTDAEGVFLIDSKGKKYFDLASGVSVSNIGHKNPDVITATKAQVDRYLHLMVYGEYIQYPQVQFAKLLIEHIGGKFEQVYFVNSGSEAIEGAIKLAKRYTGRTGLISFTNAYHGSTHGPLSIMGSEIYKNAFRPLLPDVSVLEFNNIDSLKRITTRTACVVAEPVQAEAGVILPGAGFLEAIRKRCSDTGTVLIFDEVQTGMGRCGSLFAFQKYNVEPDILVLAKALGGGMPLGAFIASEKMMSCLTNNPPLGHITTFGGHPVCCAAGHAALNFIIREKLTERVTENEAIFVRKLSDHPAIKGIRHSGLLMAVDLGSNEKLDIFMKKALENGIIADPFLFFAGAFRIAPPLTISNSEVSECCEIIRFCLDE